MTAALATSASGAEAGLAYAALRGGHRDNYLRLLAGHLGLTPAVGPLTGRMARALLRTPRLCFASVDDGFGVFFLISAARALMGRPTFALLLRPQACFDAPGPPQRIKRALLAAWRHLPRLSIATILPFEVDPRFRTIARLGLHDPELWDLTAEGPLRRPPTTSLSEEVLGRAGGRPIVVMLGGLSAHKAFAAFCDLARHGGTGPAQLLVAAGRLDPACRGAADRLAGAGGMLVDRPLSDEELLSLYGIADRIWACYTPDYDQASGIFGRAVQHGVVPIVREGSRIHRLADLEGLPVETLEIAPDGGLVRPPAPFAPRAAAVPSGRIKAWRDDFWREARRALALPSPAGRPGAQP